MITKNIGMLLLAIYLIAVGIFALTGFGIGILIGLLALVAGIFIVIERRRMITKNIGMLLLAIYLIAVGILTLTGLGIGIITGVPALLAGIFILIGR
jgi:hypothetical protein